MNMPDVRKYNRGIHLWTEDVIKFQSNCKNYQGGLTGFIRDEFHKAMGKYNLSKKDKVLLQEAILRAETKRKGRKVRQGKAAVVDRLSELTAKAASRKAAAEAHGYGVSVMSIPKRVREQARFVKTDAGKTAMKRRAK